MLYSVPLAPTVLPSSESCPLNRSTARFVQRTRHANNHATFPKSIDCNLHLACVMKCVWGAGVPRLLVPIAESCRQENRRRDRSREERKFRVISWPDFLSNASGHLVEGIFLLLARERSV